jgi:membrane protein DedA with SNARE-associated domain
MTFSKAIFLSLLYQESELYTADYISISDTGLILLVLAALAVILLVVVYWWIRRRNKS